MTGLIGLTIRLRRHSAGKPLVMTMAACAALGLALLVKLAVVPGSAANTVAAQAPGGVYLLAHTPDWHNTILSLDLGSGRVQEVFKAHGGSVMVVSNDPGYVYVYDEGRPAPQGSLSRVRLQDGRVMWTVPVPSFPATWWPEQALWLSEAGDRAYLLGVDVEDLSQLHLYTVDTVRRTLLADRAIRFPWPINDVARHPMAWKIPWSDTLVVAAGDGLFSMDMATGERLWSTRLLDPQEVSRVPLNLARGLYVWGGHLDRVSRRLLLATSTQELLSIDLSAASPTPKQVFRLPPGWQFAGFQGVIGDGSGEVAYLEVRRTESPVLSREMVEEVWVVDLGGRGLLTRVRLEEVLPSAEVSGGAVRGSGMAWVEGMQVPGFLATSGILFLDRTGSVPPERGWVPMDWSMTPAPLWYTLLAKGQ